MPRDISHGAIAGAVVGACIGFFLLLLCVSPFIARAIKDHQRRRLSKTDGTDASSPPAQPDSSRRLSAGQALHSATSAAFRPFKRKAGWQDDSAQSWQLDEEPWRKPTDATPPAQPAQPSAPASEQSTRPTEPAAPSVTDFTPQGGTVPVASTVPGEALPPAHLEALNLQPTTSNDSSQHHHHHVHLPHAIQHIADVVRKQTRHSGDPDFNTVSRSTTWASSDQDPYLSPSLSAPMILDPSWTDDPHGAAYSYYHDPDILGESPPSEQGFTTQPLTTGAPSSAPYQTGSGSAPAGLSSVPRTSLPNVSSLRQGQPSSAVASPATASSPDVRQESQDDESTVSPGTPVGRPTGLPQSAGPRGRLQELRTESLDGQLGKKPMRMDTLPLTGITADSPVAGQAIDIPAPSINPMAIMPASNPAEQGHLVKHELDVIANSPPQPVFAANVTYPTEVDADGEAEGLSEYDSEYAQEDMDGVEVDISDISTPPPFSPPSGASIENTPDTRISDAFTSSPSPRPPPHEEPVFQNGDHLTPASPQRFICDICGREFDLFHKLNHHRRYHERPHECDHPGCGKKFGTKTHLERHKNDKHVKVRNYYCMVPNCPYSRQGGKSFSRKDNWRRHMQNKHQITSEAEPGPEYIDEAMGGL